MSAHELTLPALIADCAARLEQAQVAYGHGTTCAHDEAAWLVLWQLDLPLDTPLDNPDLDLLPLPASSIDAARQLIERRIATRQPAAYLTREAWLQGVPFYVDERVIVPRSFIAEVIADGSVDAWLSDATHRVLDLCTGNGSLAVLAAMAWPDIAIDAADLSEDALAVARINVDRHQLQDRITLLHSDGLGSVRGPYDLILCNPPYVNAQSMAALPPEFQAEPTLALASGADGMDFCRDLIAALRAEPERYLSENGLLVLEIGNERTHFEAAFPDLPAVWLDTSAGTDSLLLLTREALVL
jgi:ribosomal protein L3 glutamine methyltransferase